MECMAFDQAAGRFFAHITLNGRLVKIMRMIAVCFVALMISQCIAAKPMISNVVFEQDSGSCLVRISYSLSGSDAIVTADILTNGVSIGAKNFRNVWGDVNRVISVSEADVREIYWSPGTDWPGYLVDDGSLSVKLSVHPLFNPPQYMAICLGDPNAPKFFYSCEDALPEGITASRWKTDWVLMRKIEAAGVKWRMGSPGYEQMRDTREKAHLVTLSEDYYIAVYPMTQRQHFIAYKTLNVQAQSSGTAKSQPSIFQGRVNSDMRPVENVQWHTLRGDGGVSSDGAAISDKPYSWPAKGHAVNPNYMIGKLRAKYNVEFDLPTEAQWEYACRAGSGNDVYDWNAGIDNLAWTSNNSAVVENGVEIRQTHPVGLKKPNTFGLYDMLGNVQEWTLDFHASQMPHNVDGSPIIDPVGPDKLENMHGKGAYRVRKGGSYNDVNCRSSAHGIPYYSQNANSAIIGYRLCAPVKLMD